MVNSLNKIKVVAVDLDGPLLVDTFSPVLHKICEINDWEYTAEFERNTFSQSREIFFSLITGISFPLVFSVDVYFVPSTVTKRSS